MRAVMCASVIPPPPHRHTPCDHIRGEAEHEGAYEGADLPCSSLSSPLLLLQATLAYTVSKESLVGL